VIRTYSWHTHSQAGARVGTDPAPAFLQVYFALALGSDVAELVQWSAAELLHDLRTRETHGAPTSVSLFRLAQWAQDAALVSRCDCRLTRGSLGARASSFDVPPSRIMNRALSLETV
jgi:hypothetical protein